MIDGDILTIGLTDYAFNGAQEVIHVDLPRSSTFFNKTDVVATVNIGIEEVELHAPITGEIADTNEILSDEPESLLNLEGEDRWIVKMFIEDEDELSDLMDEDEYQEYLETL